MVDYFKKSISFYCNSIDVFYLFNKSFFQNMCRLAVVFNSNIFDRKGLFNSVINCVYYLKKKNKFDIDVYLIQYYYPFYLRVFKKTNPSYNIKPSKSLKRLS